MKLQIKFHGWHDVELNGDLLTGDTFKCKDFIKKYLDGKWDGQRKGWVVDPQKVARYTAANGTTIMVK
jgi:hypothetical protein